jgi:hypothetical protein
MQHLGTGARIHGEVGEHVGHRVVGSRLVGPMANTDLVRETTSLGVKLQEPRVLGRSVIAKLAEDERAVTNHFEVRPLVSPCRT